MTNETSQIPSKPNTDETQFLGEDLPEYVVGIGASAGGLEALQNLFACMPLETGMAFVVVQHLSPDYKSLMDELLSRKTLLPVSVAKNQVALMANNIYLLPPKKEMIVSNGKLLLTERDDGGAFTLPINTFLGSLAESYQEKSIAIILSGTGSDGSLGAPTVHDSGGFVIAQSPETCKFDGMPTSVINTSKVDLILPPGDIPEALVRYSKRTNKVTQQIALGSIDAEEGQFTDILMLLNNRFDLDFSQYKPSTIARRLERRLLLQKASNLKEYTKILLRDEDELETLYFDLLIGVTQFFRDLNAFERLRQEIKKLLSITNPSEEFRAWSLACATGQEAYTMAIMLYDTIETEQLEHNFKVFATDIHKHSIDIAAQGIYTLIELKGLSDYYREKYFKETAVSGRFQVIPGIRKKIVFAQHNILKDPPFTKTHLISCRNLLIYFNQSAQQRVLSLMTFSLKQKGLLFLGPSESIGRHGEEFKVIDQAHKIFRKTQETLRSPDFNLTGVRVIKNLHFPTEVVAGRASSLKSNKALDVLLQRFVPPSLLLDSAGLVLHVFGEAGEFLMQDSGSPSLNLRSMVTGQAKAVITQMLSRVSKTHKPLLTRAVKGFARHDSVNVELRPLSDSPSDIEYMLVIFQLPVEKKILEPTDNDNAGLSLEVLNRGDGTSQHMAELEEQLKFTQESLQSTVEELETSNEELQASNEELMASNEELQSTNEELQSVNEELFTVNSEFQAKERERAEIAAIIESSGVGILFLDECLTIRKLSKVAAEIFSLIDTDFGRAFSAIPSRLVQDVLSDIKQVLAHGSMMEREVSSHDGETYQMHLYRLEPLEENGNNQGGVVLTFTNISKLVSVQSNLERSEELFQNVLDTLTDGYFEWVIGEPSLFMSDDCLETLGYSNGQEVSWPVLLGEDSDTILSQFNEAKELDVGVEEILSLHCANGSIHWMLCKARFTSCTKNGKKVRRMAGQFIDFQGHKDLEHDLEVQMKDLARSNDLLEEFAHIVSHDLKAPIRHGLSHLRFLREALGKNDQKAIQDDVDALQKNLQVLQSMIDDVIRFSRVTSDKVNEKVIDLNEVVRDALGLLEVVIKNKGVHVQFDPLPIIVGDRSMLVHLFQNIFSNACKYNDKDKPEIKIDCEFKSINCIIKVHDNGIGFNVDYAKSIFKPFRRLVTKTQYEGSGIGLSICKTIIEQHNGDISVESKPGQGSTFFVTLPMQDAKLINKDQKS